MARFSPPTISVPRVGVEFHSMRVLALGLSANDVATRLGVSRAALASWERSWQPVAEPRAGAWRKALADAARERRDRLAREGLPARQMAGSDFARALCVLTSATTRDPADAAG